MRRKEISDFEFNNWLQAMKEATGKWKVISYNSQNGDMELENKNRLVFITLTKGVGDAPLHHFWSGNLVKEDYGTYGIKLRKEYVWELSFRSLDKLMQELLPKIQSLELEKMYIKFLNRQNVMAGAYDNYDYGDGPDA